VPRDGKEPASGGESGGAGRRRALVALLVVFALIGLTLYVGRVLKHSSQTEDCEMQGRTNCEPIATSPN
jgi:hypothetical protein